MLPLAGNLLKSAIVSCLLSCVVADATVAVTTPVVADPPIGISVNRANKGDRALTAIQPANRHVIPVKSPNVDKPPFGCEPAFSPIAAAVRADLVTYCAT
jgi:hypothetical protein